LAINSVGYRETKQSDAFLQAMKMPKSAISEEILKLGTISFARFMELALYCPETGYYETEKNKIGRGGDFITSVSVGNLFGELLAFQFSEWLEELRIQNLKLKTQNSKLRIVEAGAHDGKLAADILNWLEKNRPQLFSQIDYCILEPSARRQEWQKQMLKKFAGKVFWFADFENLKPETQKLKPSGIIFSNELLDAFPIQRFGWNAREKTWSEWGVTMENEKFIWKKIYDSKIKTQNPELNLSPELLAVLPNGYLIEISEPAENWWRAAAEILDCGKLLTFDYGYTADEQFSPARAHGTLRGYFRQHHADDLLAKPGEQDLTAHVNFSALQKAGEDAGLKTEFFGAQSKFLTQILEKTFAKKIPLEKISGDLTPAQIRQFQTLTHPEHLGRAFKVLVQAR
jgi:SAM-dependent MidA family methyltransferase